MVARSVKPRHARVSLGICEGSLPGYRVERSEIHRQIMTQARDEAVRILKDDPSLNGERGDARRRLLYPLCARRSDLVDWGG